MRIVLHIGTHKTGTSSIQNVLARNRDGLAAHGVHYPLSPHSGRNVNFLAARVATDRLAEARDFLGTAATEARRRGCDRLLLSAESFYAMTGFFHNLVDRPTRAYWESERAAVGRLKDLLLEATGATDIRVVVYLRAQDRFLESIYGQFVKQAPGFGDGIDRFIETAGPIADYAGHLEIWGEAFGDQALRVRRYDAVTQDLVGDFLRTALNLADDSAFAAGGTHVNPGLAGELLAFKRALNRVEQPLVDAFIASKVVAGMNAGHPGAGAPVFMLTPSARAALRDAHRPGNRALARRFLGPDEAETGTEDPIAPRQECPEPTDSLSQERGLTLYRDFRREMDRPAVRAELILRRAVRGLLTRWPWLERPLGALRRIVNRRRVRREAAPTRR